MKKYKIVKPFKFAAILCAVAAIIISFCIYKSISKPSNNNIIEKNDTKLNIQNTVNKDTAVTKPHCANPKLTAYKNTAVPKIPILMYHSIAYQKGNDLRIPKDKFYLEMKFLKESGYTFLSLDELYSIFSGTAKSPKKPLVITLDDGYEDNYINAYPILKEMGIKATIFDITDYIDKNNSYINSIQIKEMMKNGIAVESHTYNHDDLSRLSYNAQYQTLEKSRKELGNIEGKTINYIAYPSGKYNKYTEKAVKNAGYIMAVTTKFGFALKNNGLFFLHRVRIGNSLNLKQFESIFN